MALAAILLIQIWAGIALRGLYADGAFYAEQLLLREAFTIIAPARWTSETLIQTPTILALRLGQDSPHAVALSFSLAGNLMPLTLTLACVGVLPRRDRAYALLPILIFLAASMSAGVASVADGPTAAAYLWLLLLLILFGPLTRGRIVGILLLAAGAVRLHEAVAFIGPILVFACLWRRQTALEGAERTVLALAALLILAGCALAINDVVHPESAANRASLITDLVSLHWLVSDGRVSISALAGLIGLAALPAAALPSALRVAAMPALLLVFITLAALGLVAPPCPAAAFAARDNACLLTAPAMMLMLVLKATGRQPPAAAAALLAMLGLATAAADGAATMGWITYTDAVRSALSASHGVVPWGDAMAKLRVSQTATMQRYSWPWTMPLMSFWLARGSLIDTIIANPPGASWQPFDPEAVRGALVRDAEAPTREQFVAMLKRYPVRWDHRVGIFAFLVENPNS